MDFTSVLSFDEKVSLNLSALFESYGYKKYKMSKFEEYDLYLENKNFLLSENVIAFNDPTGKLMALKPDVTLSIAKNTADGETDTRKLFYSENVYRVSGNMHEFKEIPQIGLEYIGEIDLYALCEVLLIAKKSLSVISPQYLLDISHMGLLIGLLEETGLPFEAREQITACVGTKNAHEIKNICEKNEVEPSLAQKIVTLAGLYGNIDKILPEAEKLVVNATGKASLEELASVCELIKNIGEADRVNIDFSVVSDITYYNGITFRGFAENIPGVILSGGRYDNLLKKLGKKAGAVGFAVYMDLLSYLDKDKDRYDADVLLLYDKSVAAQTVFKAVNELKAQGKRVFASPTECKNIRYKTVQRLTAGGDNNE